MPLGVGTIQSTEGLSRAKRQRKERSLPPLELGHSLRPQTWALLAISLQVADSTAGHRLFRLHSCMSRMYTQSSLSSVSMGIPDQHSAYKWNALPWEIIDSVMFMQRLLTHQARVIAMRPYLSDFEGHRWVCGNTHKAETFGSSPGRGPRYSAHRLYISIHAQILG